MVAGKGPELEAARPAADPEAACIRPGMGGERKGCSKQDSMDSPGHKYPREKFPGTEFVEVWRGR